MNNTISHKEPRKPIRRLTFAILWYIGVLFFSLIPSTNLVSNSIPEEGDNFKSPENSTVYYYHGKMKYSYSSIECYFSKGNPPFGTSPDQGGIQVVQAHIVDQIPLAGGVCEKGLTFQRNEYKPTTLSKTREYILDISDYGHLPAYFVMFLLVLSYCRSKAFSHALVWSCIITFSAGLFVELLQGILPLGREASIKDLLINTIGILLGMCVYYLSTKVKPKL